MCRPRRSPSELARHDARGGDRRVHAVHTHRKFRFEIASCHDDHELLWLLHRKSGGPCAAAAQRAAAAGAGQRGHHDIQAHTRVHFLANESFTNEWNSKRLE